MPYIGAPAPSRPSFIEPRRFLNRRSAYHGNSTSVSREHSRDVVCTSCKNPFPSDSPLVLLCSFDSPAGEIPLACLSHCGEAARFHSCSRPLLAELQYVPRIVKLHWALTEDPRPCGQPRASVDQCVLSSGWKLAPHSLQQRHQGGRDEPFGDSEACACNSGPS